ncbi:hypothetical protein DFP72DRAFT_1180412 [Ephemerocybe angulata]|uniref:Uncharacterized protein n=1 Tax=Ephemerocybe angulata TaxID=980116 RepID=A0A8H6LUQ9_9AGAR|nr:hypothetical protein DFP72DRAFT_1180412 [Tulosesus angulatus]
MDARWPTPFCDTPRGSERDVTTIRRIVQLQALDVTLYLSLTSLTLLLSSVAVLEAREKTRHRRLKSKTPRQPTLDNGPRPGTNQYMDFLRPLRTEHLPPSIWRAIRRYNPILFKAEGYSKQNGAGEGGSALAQRRAPVATFEDANAQSAWRTRTPRTTPIDDDEGGEEESYRNALAASLRPESSELLPAFDPETIGYTHVPENATA